MQSMMYERARELLPPGRCDLRNHPSQRDSAGTSSSWIRDYVYRGAQLLAQDDGGQVLFLHLDHLGSLRQVTDDVGEVIEDHDFLPFGEEITSLTTESLLFTGHERDSHGAGSADDLDYMHARYCSPHVGRFLSVDPKQRKRATKKPQKWNRYAYTRNNPLKLVDPNDLEEITFQLSTFINQATVGPLFGSFAGGTKTFHQVTIETDRGIAGNNPIVRQSKFVGKTEQRSLFNSKVTAGQAQASTSGLTAAGSFDAQGNAVLTMGVAAANPMVAGAPEINESMTATVDPAGESFDVNAGVDGFPTTAAAAVTAEGEQIQIFLVEEGVSPILLFDGLGDQEINVHCTSDGCEPEPE